MTELAIERSGRFAIGDVVTLKSGGPKMTVVGFEPAPHEHHPPRVKTNWFNDQHQFAHGVFHETSLDGGSAQASAPVAKPEEF